MLQPDQQNASKRSSHVQESAEQCWEELVRQRDQALLSPRLTFWEPFGNWFRMLQRTQVQSTHVLIPGCNQMGNIPVSQKSR